MAGSTLNHETHDHAHWFHSVREGRALHLCRAGHQLVLNHSHGQHETHAAADDTHGQDLTECYPERQPLACEQTEQGRLGYQGQLLYRDQGGEGGNSAGPNPNKPADLQSS